MHALGYKTKLCKVVCLSARETKTDREIIIFPLFQLKVTPHKSGCKSFFLCVFLFAQLRLPYKYLCQRLSSLRVWSASQRDAHEPQSHHSTSDVWSARCGHKWLDWRHLFHTLEENTESKERSEKLLTHQWFHRWRQAESNKISNISVVINVNEITFCVIKEHFVFLFGHYFHFTVRKLILKNGAY